MTTEPGVTSTNASVRARIVWTIVLGFAADPLMRWSWPDPGQYVGNMTQFIKACGGRAFEHGTAYVTRDSRAAALWLPPGVQQDEDALDAIMALSLRPEISEHMAHLRQGMAEHHPCEPHWYLPLIAVDPNWAGQGLGTLLMKYALQRCDEQGIAAYLESSNPENIPFTNATVSRLLERYSTVAHRHLRRCCESRIERNSEMLRMLRPPSVLGDAELRCIASSGWLLDNFSPVIGRAPSNCSGGL
ncbi:GNAT family N-acetyltransferase [Bradyrhizobium sp. RDM4]|uniref:GNAT family N-acetyltransferase n=1 Tax=Bradyrhizobium sp. RDM4 TaxID=3378765 RepID=UPI0038FCC500